MTKNCPRCCVECAEEAQICHSCAFSFSKFRRYWKLTLNVASAISLFVGLIVVVINQSTQILERLKPTEFVYLGIGSSTSANRLMTDNFTLGIKSSGFISLEKLKFTGSDEISSQLNMGILVGKSYKSTDIANIRIDPTAIDRSYNPAPYEMLALFSKYGFSNEQLPFFFKVRPTSQENRVFIENSWASIPGKSTIYYFELNDEPHKRLFKEYDVDLILWVRKLENLENVLSRPEFNSIDSASLLKDYKEIYKKIEKNT